MKKWLILFVVVDFLFVGLVLRLSSQNERNIASVDSQDDLNKGQQQKYDLVKSLQFNYDHESLVLKTEKLQLICETYASIELKFVAINVAFAGEQPSIKHLYPCNEIKKDLGVNTLKTSIENFKSMHKQKILLLENSSMYAAQVYSDEEFPTEWQLAEIGVAGESNFTINQFEIEKVHSTHAFEFTVTSAK